MGGDELKAVLPLGHGALWAWQARPWVMGILNVTPDSFSDGGAYLEASRVSTCSCIVRYWLCRMVARPAWVLGTLSVMFNSFSNIVACKEPRAFVEIAWLTTVAATGQGQPWGMGMGIANGTQYFLQWQRML